MKRVGFLINENEYLSKYLYETINSISNSGECEVFLLVSKQTEFGSIFKRVYQAIKSKKFMKLVNNFVFYKYAKLEQLFFSLNNRNVKEHYKKERLDFSNFETIQLHPIYSKSGLLVSYPSDDISRISSLGLDIIVRGNAHGIFQGDILNCSKHGIISFHHGDNSWNRGGPPGFWEVQKKISSTGFIIQLLNSELDGGLVLFKGKIQTQRSYIENVTLLYKQSNRYLADLTLKILEQNDILSKEPSYPFSGPIYVTPTLVSLVKYLYKVWPRFIYRTIRSRLGYKVSWEVRYSKTPWRGLVCRKSKAIKNPDGGFFADPFIVQKDDRHIIFVEEYCYHKKKGFISAIEIDSGDKYTYLGKIIENDYHMSFPFCFEYEGELYMVPETHKNKTIELYRCCSFPSIWEFERTLFKDIDCADTMIFEKDELWWMLSNVSTVDSHHHSNLSIFYTDDPVNGEWTSHLNNPINANSDHSRNAGLIIEADGQIIRCRQKQGFDNYGEEISFSSVDLLSRSEFEESYICSLKSEFESKLNGIHHLTTDSQYTVYDCSTIKRIKV